MYLSGVDYQNKDNKTDDNNKSNHDDDKSCML